MNSLVVLNRSSGKVDGHLDLDRLFAKHRLQPVEMTRHTDLQKLLADAHRSGIQTIVAAGGDGTVNAMVNAIMSVDLRQRPRLAILPLGTANDFAATLSIPDAVDEALALLQTGQHVPIDVVKISAQDYSRYYANVAAGGNSVRVTEAMTEEMKARWGAFCYLRGGMEVLGDLKTFKVTAQCDDERFEDFAAWAVMVANGRTNAGRIVVAPQASPVDGLLDVILIRDGTMVDMVEMVTGALLGNYLDCEQVVFRQVKRFSLHSDPGMRFTLDGEVIDREPVEFAAVPGAIEMFVGTQFLLDHRELIARQDSPTSPKPPHNLLTSGVQNA